MTEKTEQIRRGTGSFRSKLDWINQNIIDPETRLKSVNIIYSVLAVVVLMNHIHATLYFNERYNFSFTTPVPWCVFAVISIVMGRMWKDKGFLLFLLLIVIKVVRLCVETGDVFTNLLYANLYAIGGCYAVGRVLTGESRKKFIIAFCTVWTIAMVVFSCIGIHVAWTGEPLNNLANGSFRIVARPKRLFPIYHPVQAGVLASVSIAAAMVGIYALKKKFVKILFLPCILAIFICGLLTSSRVNHILNAAALSLLICILLYDRVKSPVNLWKAAGILVAGTVVFVGFTYIQGYGISIYNYIRTNGNGLISRAFAEDAVMLSTRKIKLGKGLDTFLNGRISTWNTFFQTLVKNPSILLWGRSCQNPMAPVNELRAALGLETMSHMHNVWFQTLLENGLPGFLLYTGFTVYVLINGFQLLINKTCPVWQRLLPIPCICCMMGDLIDVTCFAETGHPQATIMFLFAGFTVAVNRELRKLHRVSTKGR